MHEVTHPNLGLVGLVAPPPAIAPNLGPLSAFVGTWTGRGFNTIFRPDNPKTPTPFTPPITSDNVLELNLTEETLSFETSLGSIPNRGTDPQGDIFLNGVPYLQTINDVTTLPATGIHFEPGLWLSVPATTTPNEPQTVARMASIPHGTTIVAQGTVVAAVAGPPKIDPVDITPFAGGKPLNKIRFASQTATNAATPRLPQNLAPFIAAGTITQAMLDDPNTVLRDQIQHQTITETIVIGISTNTAAPLFGGPLRGGATPTTPPPPITPDFGGGTDNIAFLQGVPNPPPSAVGPNAQSLQMDAVFWIETVEYEIDVPELLAGSPPVVLQPIATVPKVPLTPSFVASVPFIPGKRFPGGKIKMKTTQIQYTQKVILNFAALSWPHVSVASLVPSSPIEIPDYLLPLV
ncbi:hypothetical protein DYH55_23055 [Methylovirgula sp. 4M-Z18]|nr:hypothetical protein DYH55_23055 [Methylovirgula sp. 4M-Z18]